MPTDRFFPGEPDDVKDVADARHWAAVYVLALTDLSRLADASPSPDSISRILILQARLKWWQRRQAELEDVSRSSSGSGLR